MDDIGQRLRDSSDQCMVSYATWSKAKRDTAAREALLEAVHELRKVAARLEIEIAASERDEMTQRPLAIPPHRSSKRRPGEGNDLPDFLTPDGDDSTGNVMPSERQPSSSQGHSGSHSGGHSAGGNHRPRQHGGGQRRPMRRPQE